MSDPNFHDKVRADILSNVTDDTARFITSYMLALVDDHEQRMAALFPAIDDDITVTTVADTDKVNS